MADETTAEQAAAKQLAEAQEKQQAEAAKAAEKEAKEIAKSAEANRPEPEAPPEEEPEKKEKTTFIVYKAVKGMPYPGKYLTVSLDDLDETIVLEDGVPAEHPNSVAKAACALESPSYTIESA
jgi:sRNA-binding protein